MGSVLGCSLEPWLLSAPFGRAGSVTSRYSLETSGPQVVGGRNESLKMVKSY